MKRYNTTGDYHFPLEEHIDGEFVTYEDAMAAMIPEGYVLVPVEPTDKIIDAFWKVVEEDKEARISNVYRAMIQAAQEEE